MYRPCCRPPCRWPRSACPGAPAAQPLRPISLLTLHPTNIAGVKLSGRIPRKSLWAWEFHPLNLRLCSSQTP